MSILRQVLAVRRHQALVDRASDKGHAAASDRVGRRSANMTVPGRNSRSHNGVSSYQHFAGFVIEKWRPNSPTGDRVGGPDEQQAVSPLRQRDQVVIKS